MGNCVKPLPEQTKNNINNNVSRVCVQHLANGARIRFVAPAGCGGSAERDVVELGTGLGTHEPNTWASMSSLTADLCTTVLCCPLFLLPVYSAS